MDINDQLSDIQRSVLSLKPEIILMAGLVLIIAAGFMKLKSISFYNIMAAAIFISACVATLMGAGPVTGLFQNMLVLDGFSVYMKVLLNLGAIFTCILSLHNENTRRYPSEFAALLITVVLGGHFLLMSANLLMVFISLEIVSISSYVLAGFAFSRKGSEGSLKYFLFGALSSAVMLYGLSILYGLTGTLDFTTENFAQALIGQEREIILLAGGMALAGFLFKIASAPMHAWAPDVYEAAPMPVVAFLSTVPKFAGLGALVRFVLALNVYGQTAIDWQTIICFIAILTITVGNFAALSQRDAKRMMAWSSIAQSGFLMVGLAAFSPQGLQFMLFYATLYLVVNFVVFIYLDLFEKQGIQSMAGFSGSGKTYGAYLIFLLIGLIALAGLPPTAGFTSKLLIFSALWQSYELNGKAVLLWLLVFGLLNTVVSLFYYLKIPYYAFLKQTAPGNAFPEGFKKQNFVTIQNLLGLLLVIVVLVLFFAPGFLMGWINKINFAF